MIHNISNVYDGKRNNIPVIGAGIKTWLKIAASFYVTAECVAIDI